MRISQAEVPRVLGVKDKPQIGAGSIIEEGRDLTLVATGIALHRVKEARRILCRKAIYARRISHRRRKSSYCSHVEELRRFRR